MILHSHRVLVNGVLGEYSIEVEDDKIKSVTPGKLENHLPFRSFGNHVIMPGLIDCHVHINEPGRTEWEGFDTATKAAAAGGITTLIEMPLNSDPVTTDVPSFLLKINAAKDKVHVNVGFWGGLVPGNNKHIGSMIDAGTFGIKAFLTHSGIDEFPNVKENDLRKAMTILKDFNVPLLAHCEIDVLHEGIDELTLNPTSYNAYLNSRPKEWENNAVKLMIKLCEEYKVRTHIVHLSSSESLEMISAAKIKGLPISVETCPHYLCLSAEDIPDGAVEFKCAPPIREAENNEKLWEALKSGILDFVVSDHSPAPPHLKSIDSGNFATAWGGIAGLQFNLPVFWTEAQKRGFTISDLSRLMCSNIATFIGLNHRKGKIEVGFDADITIWDPDESFEIKKTNIFHRHKVCPYIGRKVRGKTVLTVVNGNVVFDAGEISNQQKGSVLFNEL